MSLRSFLSCLLASSLIVTAAAPAARAEGVPMETPAKQAIVIDYDTGAVLMEKNADERMPTSSMSKVITMCVVFDALNKGQIRLTDEAQVSEKAWRMQGSKMFIEVGKTVKIEDLIRGVLIQSGNDATIALAEHIAGTEDAFAEMLNRKAQEFGMTNSHFTNASGWPDDNHYSTARDLARLGWHTVADYPDQYPYYAEMEFVYNNIRQHNRNPLLTQNIGADGIKTGHTEAGGYGLIGSGVRNGRRVILVVNGLPDMKARAQESGRLLDWALRSFDNISFVEPGKPLMNVPVAMGRVERVGLTSDAPIKVTIPAIAKADTKVSVVYKRPLMAPIQKGQKVAVLRIDVPQMGVREYPLVASEDVPRVGMVAGVMAKAALMLTGGDMGVSE